jgi:Putative adhesin
MARRQSSLAPVALCIMRWRSVLCTPGQSAVSGVIRSLALGAVLSVMLTTLVTAQSRTVSRGWRVTPNAAVKVYASSGTLSIEAWGEDSVAISGTLAEGESLFGGGSPSGLKLGAEGTTRSGASRLTVHVPAGIQLVVRSGAASVDVRGVTGTADIGSAAGDVKISGELRMIAVESISGDVHVAGSAPTARIRNTNGEIRLAGRYREAVLTNVNGTVHVTGLPIGSARIETVGGDVHVEGRIDASGSLDIETFGGAVSLEFPARQRAALNVRTSSGDISGRLESPLANVMTASLSDAVERVGGASVLMRELGAGPQRAAPVTIRTFRGRVRIDALRRRTE